MPAQVLFISHEFWSIHTEPWATGGYTHEGGSLDVVERLLPSAGVAAWEPMPKMKSLLLWCCGARRRRPRARRLWRDGGALRVRASPWTHAQLRGARFHRCRRAGRAQRRRRWAHTACWFVAATTAHGRSPRPRFSTSAPTSGRWCSRCRRRAPASQGLAMGWPPRWHHRRRLGTSATHGRGLG